MKERICPNCEAIKEPNTKRHGSVFLCFFSWIFFIFGGIIGLLLAFVALPVYCILGVIIFIFCIYYTGSIMFSEKLYFCPTCGAANPLPPKSAKVLDILGKLQSKGDEDAIRIIGFIREEEKAKTKAWF